MDKERRERSEMKGREKSNSRERREESNKERGQWKDKGEILNGGRRPRGKRESIER